MKDNLKTQIATEDEAMNDAIAAQIHAIVREIPAGKVLSYGAVGERSTPPISGYICGRIMGHVPPDVPWWRVVGKDGNLPIRKRHPELSIQQRDLLISEGVEFDESGRVIMAEFADL